MKRSNGSSVYWTIEFNPDARRDFRRLDKMIRDRIDRYIKDRILTLEHPRDKGKALKGSKQELWCYRVGEYRLICRMEDQRLVVIIIKIGHRREIYR